MKLKPGQRGDATVILEKVLIFLSRALSVTLSCSCRSFLVNPFVYLFIYLWNPADVAVCPVRDKTRGLIKIWEEKRTLCLRFSFLCWKMMWLMTSALLMEANKKEIQNNLRHYLILPVLCVAQTKVADA